MNELRILQFALTKGIGDAAIKKALNYLDQSGRSWDELIRDPECFREASVARVPIDEVWAQEERAAALYSQLHDQGIIMLTEADKEYPQHLKKKLGTKCPPILFAKGNISLLNRSSVGFCGSRKVSEKGIRLAESCAQQLSDNNIVVTSGYAGGTDITTHRTALLNGGGTIFVLAEGILRYRIKSEIKDLLTADNHVFISQFMPNVTWNAGNAMKRNSVIIGLSGAMILIESGMTGGTFAAGEESLKVGCPLFVIDYKNPETSAEANPYFIAKGGIPIRGKDMKPNVSEVLSTLQNASDDSDHNDNANAPLQLKLDI